MKISVLRSAFVCLGIAFLVLVLCTPLSAQTTYGTVSGSVTDASGGLIQGAHVTLTSTDTGRKLEEDTGSDGFYTFSNIPIGHYKVTAEKSGFKRTEQADVVVQVQQTSSINLVLQLGEVSQTVEVTGETPLLQPDTSSLGQIVDQRKANEIPLNGRNVYNLASLSPSVVPQGNSQGNIVGKNPFDLGNYQIGGSFANQGAEYLDGQPLNSLYINLPVTVPTQDSVGEFKVQYNNLGPEWGKFSGGVVNFSTKSGTNTIHGSAYEFLRNRVLDANDFFVKKQQVSLGEKNQPPPYTQNQFGGTAGGPIIKDKLFIFGSYEGYRARQGVPFSSIVPTAAERTGNFADLCQTGFNTPDPNGSGINICSDQKGGKYVDQLYNPLTVNPANNQRLPIAGNNLTGNNPVTGQPYINPTAAYLLNKLVANPTNPNLVPASILSPPGEANFIQAASGGGDIDEYVFRGDYNLTSSQHLFGRYTYFKELSLPQDPYGTGLCKDRCTETTISNSGSLGWTDAISPTLAASVTFSVSRYHYLRGPKNANFDMTLEGWPAAYNPVVPNTERTPMTPCFAISDPTISCSQGQSAINDWDTQYNLSPQATKIVGRHTLAFGFQIEESFDNYLQTNTGGGLISFNGSWTAPLASNAGGNGNDYADFLLGYGLGAGAAFGNQTTGSLVISQPVASKENYRGFYAGDTWHYNSKLTLNLGVRYELPGPYSERYNRLTYFNPNVTNASVTGCNGVAGSPCLGDLFYVGTGVDRSRSALPLDLTEWSPRIGVAYALNPKTVIRSGYGIFYSPNYVSFATNPYGDVVNSATSTFFASNTAGLYPASTLNSSNCTLTNSVGGPPTGVGNKFTCTSVGPFGPNLSAPVGRNAQPNISQFGLQQTPLNTAAFTLSKPAYTQQWNLDVQRELPAGFFIDIAYAGAHGVHLQQYNTQVNQIPDAYIASAAQQYNAGQPVTIAQHITADNYPFSQILPGNLGCVVTPATIAAKAPCSLVQGQLDRPFPEYTGNSLAGVGCCGSTYQSLQISATKRFSGGGSLLVAYTNAKLISNTDTLTSWLEGSGNGGVGGVQDWNNLKGENSLSSQDVPQRLVISYVYDAPFGHGKRYLSNATGIVDKFVSGWGVDGITIFQKGFPLKITDGTSNLLAALSLGTGTIRPDVVAGCNKGGPRTTAEWFNTSCFSAALPYQFGTESRTDPTLRQEGENNWDFAIFKRTYFGPDEKFNLEFRTEFFNLFNRVQFAAPNTTCCVGNNSSFGSINSDVNNPRLIQFGLRFSF